jgi:hypothetical protein
LPRAARSPAAASNLRRLTGNTSRICAALVENAAAFGRPQWRQRAVSRLPSQPSSAVTSDRVSTSIFAVSLSEAESRSVLDERALVCGRHIFGWYFPFRVAN